MAFHARAFLGTIVVLLLAHAPAVAHPLGNFTVNHLSELSVDRGRVRLRYVLDEAEIPTFSDIREANGNGNPDAGELAAWAHVKAARLLPALTLEAGGRNVPLALGTANAHTRPGAGGLPTLYLTFEATGVLPGDATTLHYDDATWPRQIGWRDAIVLPQTEPTHELTAYPSALIGSPRATTAIAATLSNGRVTHVTVNAANTTHGAAAADAPSLMRSNQLSDMLERGTGDWRFVALTFLVAIALGALHALEPGHGKTLLAVSLVGARATVRQAAILAAALTIAHTIGVLALGLAINIFKSRFDVAAVYPWIDLVAGVAIAVIGARAVQRQIQSRRPLAHAHAHAHPAAHSHEHPHVHAPGDDHVHADGHGHDDLDDLAHARAHAIPGNAPLTFGGTVWAAMSGGVAPCPAALVVLFASLALDKVGYGIFLIVAFSFGLAITLTGLGIAVVRGASWLQKRPEFDRFVTYGPLASAIVISTIGAIMVGHGFAEQGMAISPLAVSAIVALAIVGYGFAHPAGHRHAEHA